MSKPAVIICAHADEGGPAHLLRGGEKCSRARRCPVCGATSAEVRRYGHRRFDSEGRAWPAKDERPHTRACAEACTCYPEHTTWAEHRRECP